MKQVLCIKVGNYLFTLILAIYLLKSEYITLQIIPNSGLENGRAPKNIECSMVSLFLISFLPSTDIPDLLVLLRIVVLPWNLQWYICLRVLVFYEKFWASCPDFLNCNPLIHNVLHTCLQIYQPSLLLGCFPERGV